MPIYEYRCDENGRTVEVSHPVEALIQNWGELCYIAQLDFGKTDPMSPVRRIITKAPAFAIPVSNSDLKNKGFTKLIKRDDGVYENVTATGDEKRYMKRGEKDSVPHLNKKITD